MKQSDLSLVLFRLPKKEKKKLDLKCMRIGITRQTLLVNFVSNFLKKNWRG